MPIDQVKIFVLESFSDSYILKLFGNLFLKHPAWYANDLRPNYLVWHFGRRIVLSERKLWLFCLVWTYIVCTWGLAYFNDWTWWQCSGNWGYVCLSKKVHIWSIVVILNKSQTLLLQFFLWNSPPLLWLICPY